MSTEFRAGDYIKPQTNDFHFASFNLGSKSENLPSDEAAIELAKKMKSYSAILFQNVGDEKSFTKQYPLIGHFQTYTSGDHTNPIVLNLAEFQSPDNQSFNFTAKDGKKVNVTCISTIHNATEKSCLFVSFADDEGKYREEVVQQLKRFKPHDIEIIGTTAADNFYKENKLEGDRFTLHQPTSIGGDPVLNENDKTRSIYYTRMNEPESSWFSRLGALFKAKVNQPSAVLIRDHQFQIGEIFRRTLPKNGAPNRGVIHFGLEDSPFTKFLQRISSIFTKSS